MNLALPSFFSRLSIYFSRRLIFFLFWFRNSFFLNTETISSISIHWPIDHEHVLFSKLAFFLRCAEQIHVFCFFCCFVLANPLDERLDRRTDAPELRKYFDVFVLTVNGLTMYFCVCICILYEFFFSKLNANFSLNNLKYFAARFFIFFSFFLSTKSCVWAILIWNPLDRTVR